MLSVANHNRDVGIELVNLNPEASGTPQKQRVRQCLGKVASRKEGLNFIICCQSSLILKSTCHDMIQAKQDVLSLAFPHGLLMLLCDCHINLVATAHTFWEWMTTVMNWLLCRISLPTPPPCLDPCRLNFF